MEKMKDISYKNYYQMLMDGNDSTSRMDVSPFAKRDAMKQEHINHAIEDQRKKSSRMKSIEHVDSIYEGKLSQRPPIAAWREE